MQEEEMIRSKRQYLTQITIKEQKMNNNLYELTKREKEVYEFLIKGYEPIEISEQLGIRYTTTRTHINAICDKKGFNGKHRIQKLVCDYYIKNGGKELY